MKHYLKIIGIILTVIVGTIIILLLILNHFFFSMHHLPDGELITEVASPTGKYTVKAYVSESGATVADAVRAEVIFHEKKDKKKNIYWEYRESEAEIVWLDDDTVLVNNMALDVRKDVYDWRKE